MQNDPFRVRLAIYLIAAGADVVPSAKLPAQCRQRQFTGLDAAAGGRPDHRCASRYSWMREAEAAQQDTVIIGQDDRSDGMS